MKNKKTPQQTNYKIFSDRKAPSSNTSLNCIKAFLAGGMICIIGQVLSEIYKNIGLTEEKAASAVSITLIFVGVLLTGLGLYHKIAKHAGAGTLVPITGFANAVASPAIEAKTEGYIIGVGTKIFTIAGPVIAYGALCSFVAGIIFYFMK